MTRLETLPLTMVTMPAVVTTTPLAQSIILELVGPSHKVIIKVGDEDGVKQCSGVRAIISAPIPLHSNKSYFKKQSK